MSETKFTPGPWRYKKMYGTQPYFVYGPMHKDGGDYAPLAEFSKEEDARLTAAAPDLLAALKEMISEGGTTSGEWVPSATYKKAVAAIQKAEGAA